MAKIYLGLGSNIGDRKAYIEKAVELLSEEVKVLKRARIYETAPLHFEDQPDFLNTAIFGETILSPLELLSFVKEVEKKVGRTPSFRFGPREIDIDILYYDDIVYKDEVLEIPHPRISERDFVKLPLAEIYSK